MTVRVCVIGGGPAGAACANQLRQQGLEVELAEREVFPREKVCGCCLAGAGLDALEMIGCGDWVLSHGRPLRRWHGSFDGRQVELVLPRGRAISRAALDAELLREAERRGVVIFQPVSARLESSDDSGALVRFRRAGRTETRRYSVVVLAGGLNAGGGGPAGGPPMLPWIDPPHGPFGVACSFAVGSALPWNGKAGVIYMACDAHGYVGMVALEDDRIEVAAALERHGDDSGGAGILGRVEAILTRSGLPTPSLSSVAAPLTTSPLHRSRLAGRGRVLAIGDAAGYVEPFTGEGMTWAMQSGIAAADRIAAERERLSGIGDRWAREHGLLMKGRRNRCRRVAWAIHSPTMRAVAGIALQRFPWLARPLLRGLERGT